MMPFCAILLTIGVANAVVTVPLVHRPKTLQEFRKVRAKRASRRVSGHGSKEAPVSVPMVDTYDADYFGEILVGTPPKKFVVLFETGTANLWLPSIGCQSCWFGPGNFYDNSSSSTSHSLPEMGAFRNFLANGTYTMDTVIIGGLTIENQIFGEAYSEVWEAMIDSPFDGIMGMGCDRLAVDSVTPPIYNLVAQGKIKHNVLGVYLDSNEGNTSMVTIGGIKKSLYTEDLFYTPWSPLQMFYPTNLLYGTDVKVGHKSSGVCSWMGCQFIIDTGSGTLAFPPQGNLVMGMLGIAAENEGAQEVENCSTVHSWLPLTYTINGKDFDLEPEFYIPKFVNFDSGEDECWLSMESIYSPLGDSTFQTGVLDLHVTTLGTPFQKKYYTAYDFDRGRIGLALAKQPAWDLMLEGKTTARMQMDTQMLFM